MPYIITETMPSNLYGTDGLKQANVPHEVSRRAVATLADARESIAPTILAASPNHVWRLAESGGTIGPLPDGTVIEVEAVAWSGPDGMYAHAGWDGVSPNFGDPIAAYNDK